MRHASRMQVTRAPLIVSCDLRISAVIVTLWRAWIVPCGSMTTASACVPPRSTPMASVSERARFMATGTARAVLWSLRNQGAASEMVRGDRIAKRSIFEAQEGVSPTQTGPADPQHDTHARGALLGRNAEPLPSLIRQTLVEGARDRQSVRPSTRRQRRCRPEIEAARAERCARTITLLNHALAKIMPLSHSLSTHAGCARV